MKNFLRSAGVFLRAVPHFLAFELIFKLMLLAIGTPVLTMLLKQTMKLSGITYLNDENIFVYLKHPSTIIVIVVMLFAYSIFSFVELSALAGCFSCYSKKQRLYTGGMFRTGLKAFVKAFKGSGILAFIGYMAIMPLAQFSLSSGMFIAPLMPVLRRIFSLKSGLAVVTYVLIQLLFIILMTSGCYSLHYLILTKNSFGDCIKKSKKKMEGQRFRMITKLLFYSLAVVSVIALLTFGVSFLLVFIIKGFSAADKAFGTALRVLRYAWNVFTAISAFLSAPVIMCWLTQKFMSDTAEEELILPARKNENANKARRFAGVAVLTALSIVMNLSYFKAIYHGNLDVNVGVLSRTQITAHRGFSHIAPENTMPAFEAAVGCGADFIELDVQLTADEQMVVFHDDKIDRTTNGRGQLKYYTYEQLQQFSAGSWFKKSDEFNDVRIPLLTEVLDAVGDDIMLNIEIKRSGDPKKTAEHLVALIEEYDLVKSVYVTSFSYPALKKVKQLNPKIKTAFIANMSTATSYAQLPYIDAVSMNYLFVNQSVVNSAHHNGKRIFVWTVDRQSEMQKMIAMGVDNIITNRPDKALELVDSKTVGDTVLNVLKYIFGS